MKHGKWLIAGILALVLLLTAGAAGILLPDPATLEQRKHLSLLKDAVAGKGEDALWKAVDEMSDEELMALIAEGSAYYQERGENWGIEGFVPVAAERIGPKITPTMLEQTLTTDGYTVEFRQLVLELAFYVNSDKEKFNGTVKNILKTRWDELPEELLCHMIVEAEWNTEMDWALLNDLFENENLPDARRRALREMGSADPEGMKPLLYKLLEQPGKIAPELFGTTCIVVSVNGETYPEIYPDAPEKMLAAVEKVLQDPSSVGDSFGLVFNTTSTLCQATEQSGLVPLLMTYQSNVDAAEIERIDTKTLMRRFGDELSFEVEQLLTSSDEEVLGWALEWAEAAPQEQYQDELEQLAKKPGFSATRAAAVLEQTKAMSASVTQ